MTYPNIDLILNNQNYHNFNLDTDFIDLISDEHIFLSCSKYKIDFTCKNNLSQGITDRFNLILPYLQKYFANIGDTNKKYNFILGLGDIENMSYPSDILCISLSKKTYMRNILIPNIDFFTKSIIPAFDIVKNTDIPYEEKLNSSIFVGSSTGISNGCNKRIRYCLLMNNDSHYAKITNLCQGSLESWKDIFPSIESVLDDKIININDQLQYKILVNIDGNTLCYSRLYWQMLSNSIPIYIEPDSSTVQFFDMPEIQNCYFVSSIQDANHTIDFIIKNQNYSKVLETIQLGKEYYYKYFFDYCQSPEDVLTYIITKIFNKLINENI